MALPPESLSEDQEVLHALRHMPFAALKPQPNLPDNALAAQTKPKRLNDQASNNQDHSPIPQPFHELWMHHEHLDIQILPNQPMTKEKELRAHKVVLAAASTTLRMLVANAAKLDAANTLLQVDASYEVIDALLRFIYQGNIQLNDLSRTSLLALYAKAIEWRLSALEWNSARVLASTLTTDSVCETLAQAAREETRARLSLTEPAESVLLLKEAASAFAAVRWNKLRTYSSFKQLSTSLRVTVFARRASSPLHLFATGLHLEEISSQELLTALLAPPYSCNIDEPMEIPSLANKHDDPSLPLVSATPLLVALSHHRWDICELLLDAGASQRSPSIAPSESESSPLRDDWLIPWRGGGTVLHAVASAGDLDACIFLLKRNVPINEIDDEGRSPLDVSIVMDHPAIVEALRERGGRTAYLADDGSGLMHTLAASGSAHPLSLIVGTDDENVNAPNGSGYTALHLAVLHGHVEAVKVLISLSANPNIFPEGGGAAPLHLAARRGSVELLKLLLDSGADAQARIHPSGENALHLCAGNAECCQLLIKEGCAVNERDATGATPLLHTVTAPHPLEACRILLSAGAKPNTTDFLSQQTALHRLCDSGGGEDAEATAKELITHGAMVGTQDKYGHTPLHIAAYRGHIELATLLVSSGASPNIPSAERMCAISPKLPSEPSLHGARPLSPNSRHQVLACIVTPPPWLADQLADECQVCAISFSASIRRHHCRHCGRIVCSTCSSHKMPIAKFGVSKPTRVCSDCRQVLLSNDGKMQPLKLDVGDMTPIKCAPVNSKFTFHDSDTVRDADTDEPFTSPLDRQVEVDNPFDSPTGSPANLSAVVSPMKECSVDAGPPSPAICNPFDVALGTSRSTNPFEDED